MFQSRQFGSGLNEMNSGTGMHDSWFPIGDIIEAVLLIQLLYGM